MKSFVKKLIMLAIIIATFMSLTTISLANDKTRANSSTTHSGVELKSILNTDSTIAMQGEVAKVTLYMSTTNVDISTKLENVASTRNGNPVFVKFGKPIYVTGSSGLTVGNVYANQETCKYDQLIDFHKGELSAPKLTPFTNDNLAKIAGFPRWLKSDLSTTNQPEVVYWVTDTANAEQDGVKKYRNLRTLIFKVAELSDDYKAGHMDSIQNVLKSTMSRATFDYREGGVATGKQITLDENSIMPAEGYVHWLVVYEPVVIMIQDPTSYFYPDKGRRAFALTATDGVLANMKAGDSNYPILEKFMVGTKTLTAHYKYCAKCKKTWYGYPSWNPPKPCAFYCPPDCDAQPGIHYPPNPLTKERRPFVLNRPFLNAARMFSVEYSWLPYSAGYLFEKPTNSLNNLITSTLNQASTQNMLKYGGYSLFVNGPAPQEPDEEKIPIYIRTVGLSDDGTNLVGIPNISVSLSTKNTEIPEEIEQQKQQFIERLSEKYPANRDYLPKQYNKIKSEDIIKTVVTKKGFAPIDLTYRGDSHNESSEVDYTLLLKGFKLYASQLNGVVVPDATTYYDLRQYIDNNINGNPVFNSLSMSEQADNLMSLYNQAAHSIQQVSPDETIIMDDGTRIGPEEEMQANWDKYIVIASKDPNINSLDQLGIEQVLLYDTEESSEIVIPDSFIVDGEPIYLTVVVSVIVKQPLPDDVHNEIISENELVRAIIPETPVMSKVNLASYYDETKCPGGYLVAFEGGVGYMACGHPRHIQYARSIIIKKATIRPEWYWSQGMFTNLPRLSVLRPDGDLQNDGKTFVFNTTEEFDAQDFDDAFAPLTDYKFLAHRNAEKSNDTPVKPLQLAAYMNTTTENKNFLNFINPYYGGTYPSTYSKPTGDYNGKTINIETSLAWPRTIDTIGDLHYCFSGNQPSLNTEIPAVLTGRMLYGGTTVVDNTFKTSTDITIDPTIASTAKANNPFTGTKQYWGINPTDTINPMYLIQLQTDTIKFNPAFKMKYQDSHENSEFKDVWVLAAGEKTFISNDYVQIELTGNNLNVIAPWSRDREDKLDESGRPRTIPTIKSGNTIKADANTTTMQIDAYIHLQDPNFVEPSRQASVQTHNNKRIKEIDDMVDSIAEKFRKDGVSFYSNMFQATTDNTVHKTTSPNFFQDLTSKTILNMANPITTNVTAQTKAYYLDANDTADYTTPTRTITINGQTIPAKDKWKDISAVRSQKKLAEILEKNGGDIIKNWYNEDYEGIIIVHKRYVISINNVTSTYAQVHPQHSDWLTARNELAQQLKHISTPDILIPEKQFGIGVEYRLPKLTINGQKFDNIVIPSAPYIFDIRGSVYDTK